MLLVVSDIQLIALTFTIGWLKQIVIKLVGTVKNGFNFHHRVVETISQVYCFIFVINFNFHHRVVETCPLLSFEYFLHL